MTSLPGLLFVIVWLGACHVGSPVVLHRSGFSCCELRYGAYAQSTLPVSQDKFILYRCYDSC
jgi:hypothetical protein